MTDLMELASRVEAGEGPDLQLDREIFDALRIVPSREDFPVYPHYAYTGSLDAGMSLVPAWAVPNMRHDGRTMLFVCQLENGIGLPWKDYHGKGQSYARALTAAALRARANQGTAHVEQ